VDCGLGDPILLEFDHVGVKRAAVSTLVHGGYSLEVIQNEVSQCELRRVNCHRRRTAERGGHFRHHAYAPVAQLA
jgi:hypothetical protein